MTIIREKCLAHILQLEYLEELVLGSCSDIDYDRLPTLKHGWKSLRTLDLSSCRRSISHIGLANLTRQAGCLSRISLRDGPDVTVDVAKCFQNFANIQCVKLDGSLVTCSSMKAISTCCVSLKEVSLRRCTGVTDEGISSLVSKHTELRKLDITWCSDITSESIECVTRLCCLLTSLRMESCYRVTKEAFCLIGIERRCCFLEELDVTDNVLDDEGLESISKCSRLTNLKLGLCHKITDEGLKHVGKNCSRLTEIDLNRAMGITYKGIEYIASGCSSLQLINISACEKVGDVSLTSLSKWCKRLKAVVTKRAL